MIEIFVNNIQKEFSFLKSKKLLLAVSGGIDSVVLTHLLHQLNYDVFLAHCNFCLRGKDADKDEQFVEELAKKLNIPFHITSFNTKEYAIKNKLSIQEAARNLRYQWFEKTRKKQQLDYILTAHNLNDSLETLLINLSRGTGLKGLTGIPTINHKIIRPLSSFSRKEIYAFAISNNIKWREDISNTDTKYTRNKIRHQVIPVLQELNSNLPESFQQTLQNLQGSNSIIQDRIEEVLEDCLELINGKEKSFNIKKLTARIKSSPKTYLYEMFYSYGFTNTNDILKLLTAQSGKQIFSKTHRLIKDRTQLLLVKLDTTIKTEIKEIKEGDIICVLEQIELHIKIRTDKPLEVNKRTILIDKQKIKFPLIVRKWQNGDYFYPIGMRGKKKLSKYFKDEKLSLFEKENTWLLLSDNKIVWVIGRRQDERYKTIKETKESLEINIVNKTE